MSTDFNFHTVVLQPTMNNLSHNHLPKELLIYEIFRRLPIRSLLVCKCVCKLWNSIISSPKFASFHLTNSPFWNDQSLLIKTKSCFLSFDCKNSEISKAEVFTETPTVYPETKGSAVASCNGLICLDDGAAESLYIWNPTTLKQIQIPYPQPLTRSQVVWGLGHVSTTEVYKLIRIYHENLMMKVQVFSFISNAWKNLDKEFEKYGLDKIPPIIGTGVSVNDMLYWTTYYTEYDVAFYDNCYHILGFHLVEEKFMPLIPLPEWSDDGFEDSPALFQRDGSLCACWKSNGGDIDIAMFKEQAGESSWMRLFHFDPGSFIYGRRFGSQKIQGVTKTGYVIHVDGEGIILLDPNQNPPKEVYSLKIPRTRNVISYVKSFLCPLDLVGHKG